METKRRYEKLEAVTPEEYKELKTLIRLASAIQGVTIDEFLKSHGYTRTSFYDNGVKGKISPYLKKCILDGTKMVGGVS